jgi:DNA-binding cell septation regulator SpoVG
VKADLSVSVLKLWLPQAKGNLKAYADVKVGPWIVRKCRLVQQEGQRFYIQLPQCKTGDGRYFPILQLEDCDLKQTILDPILKAYREQRKEDSEE